MDVQRTLLTFGGELAGSSVLYERKSGCRLDFEILNLVTSFSVKRSNINCCTLFR